MPPQTPHRDSPASRASIRSEAFGSTTQNVRSPLMIPEGSEVSFSVSDADFLPVGLSQDEEEAEESSKVRQLMDEARQLVFQAMERRNRVAAKREASKTEASKPMELSEADIARILGY